MKQVLIILLSISILFLAACSPEPEENADSMGFSAPTRQTMDKNKAVAEALPLEDSRDFEQAQKGLIASEKGLQIRDDTGAALRDTAAFSFLQGDSPSSVNPSLWRQAKLNNINGLFEVTPGIYQVRGFDLANMTLIQGKTGWIIVDPLTTRESASAAMAFIRKHLEPKPIRAIIFTHSHIDHFGGVLGVISPEDALKEQVQVIAPKGFTEEATRENIIAGPAMGRRADYQFGRLLPSSERAYVDTGLGSRIAFGNYGILSPTILVDHTPLEMIVDGVRFVFQYAPESEAPAELAFYLPDFKAYCGAEILSRNMHNLYTLRGAKVRDAVKWSGYIHEAMELFGDAEVYFASHHWPVWGKVEIHDFMEKQRDLYKYIHDQTMRMANQGLTPREISAEIALPESLDKVFYNRGYYGTLSHNSKAVYQYYLGWYDGNPANLNPLPPEDSAKRYVEYMGGADKVLEKAQDSFNKGEYQWVAEVLNHLVFAQPDHKTARALLAKTYDQMGYQAESGVWRSEYLSASYELRHGVSEKEASMAKALEIMKKTPVSGFFDSMAVRLNGPKAEGKNMVLNINFTDIGESHVLTLINAVLQHKQAPPDPHADVTLAITHDLFVRLLVGEAGLKETIFSDDLNVTGSRMDLLKFLMLLDKPDNQFNIIEP
ncbi:MAG: MBL fold metallo-hydrolase [Proteobacteria bacterium]|nr:MBL fold metallo-hydrolase [Pseudomonadota bacterium]MBU4470811.1 MBL fold metallo-hydrolase [Pseudomonadota bacterium]MCG2751461.1 MBL fold metallo-hydrolase [Desulfobacteraceae bacterium]